MPFRLPIETIARLTHDELRHNPEFMKHLSLVDALLLNAQLTPSSEFRFFLVHMLTYSLNSWGFSFIPAPCSLTGRRWWCQANTSPLASQSSM